MNEITQMKKLMESIFDSEYDVEVYPPYDVVITHGDRVVVKLDIDEWIVLNKKVVKALRKSK